MQILLTLYRLLLAACRAGVFVAFLILAIAVLTQVIGRGIGSSPIWTEELTRFALIYLTAFGAAVGLVTGDLVNVDIVCDALPGEIPRYLRILAAILTAVLAFAMLPGAWKFMQIGALQTSPAMGLQMTFVHLTIVLLVGFLAAFSIVRALLDIMKYEYRQPMEGQV